jgi:hypothetical protein
LLRSTCFCEGALSLPSSFFGDSSLDIFHLADTLSHPTHPSFHAANAAHYYQHLQESRQKGDDYCSTEVERHFLSKYQEFKDQKLLAVFIDQCWEFIQGYCNDTRKALLRYSDLHLKGNDILASGVRYLHLAAAVNDVLAVRIGLHAGLQVNEQYPYIDEMNTARATPMHVCIWFNDDPKELVELLLQSGASVSEFGHECPVHIAVARNNVAVLELFIQKFSEYVKPLLLDLLQLAISVEARDSIRFLVNRTSVRGPPRTICPSRLIPREGREMWLAPLTSMLKRKWSQEAALVLKQYNFLHAIPDNLRDGNEGMRNVIDAWLNESPWNTDEDGLDAVYWAASLGCVDLLERFCKTNRLTFSRRLQVIHSASIFDMDYSFVSLESPSSLSNEDLSDLLRICKNVLEVDKLAARSLLTNIQGLSDWNLFNSQSSTESLFMRAVEKSINDHNYDVLDLLLSLLPGGKPFYFALQSAILTGRNLLVTILLSKTAESTTVSEDDYKTFSETVRLALMHGYADSARNILQASMQTFLRDNPERLERRMPAEGKEFNAFMAESCMKLISGLSQNICNLRSSDALASDVEPEKFREYFPEDLRYACLHWISHLLGSYHWLDSGTEVLEFLDKYFLNWLEALSLLKKVDHGLRAIESLKATLVVSVLDIFPSLVPNALRQNEAMMYSRSL